MDRPRRKAAAEGRTLTALIEDGLRMVVDASKRGATTERVVPRVSSAGGGPRPGVDISNAAAVQEMEDDDYVERLKTLR
jgi:hypothetical protein